MIPLPPLTLQQIRFTTNEIFSLYKMPYNPKEEELFEYEFSQYVLDNGSSDTSNENDEDVDSDD